MEIPAPDLDKLLAYWMEWEKGQTPPGRVLSNLQTAGMRQVLEELVAESDNGGSAGAASTGAPS